MLIFNVCQWLHLCLVWCFQSVDWEHWHSELKTLGPVNLYHVLPFQSGGWWGWFTWLDLIKLVFWFWWLATGMTMAKQRTIPGRSNLGDHRTHSPPHLPENEWYTPLRMIWYTPWEWISNYTPLRMGAVKYFQGKMTEIRFRFRFFFFLSFMGGPTYLFSLDVSREGVELIIVGAFWELQQWESENRQLSEQKRKVWF